MQSKASENKKSKKQNKNDQEITLRQVFLFFKNINQQTW